MTIPVSEMTVLVSKMTVWTVFCKKTAEPAAKIAPAKTVVKKPAAKKATIQPGSY